MKLAAICDRDTAVGLRIAGIQDLFIPGENPVNTLDQIVGIFKEIPKFLLALPQHFLCFLSLSDIPIHGHRTHRISSLIFYLGN